MTHGLQTELYAREPHPRPPVRASPTGSWSPPPSSAPNNNWPLAALVLAVAVALLVGLEFLNDRQEQAEAREQAREAAHEEVAGDVASAAVHWVRALIERETVLVLARSCRAAWGGADLVADGRVLEDTDRALGGTVAEARLTQVEGQGDSYTVTFDGQLADGAPVTFAVWVVEEQRGWRQVCGVDVIGPS